RLAGGTHRSLSDGIRVNLAQAARQLAVLDLRRASSRDVNDVSNGTSRRQWEIDSEHDRDRLHSFRVCLRKRANRRAFSHRVARGTSQHGYKGCRKAGDRADLNDGCAGPQLADRFVKEYLRYAETPVIAGIRRYHPARPRF